MSPRKSFDSNGLLVLPHLHVQNANSISSPLTHGFPSITAFLGHMWALERQLAHCNVEVQFDGVGVICHGYQEQVSGDHYVKKFCLTRNPLDKDGTVAAIVEEGRVHLDVTLVFGIWSEVVNTDDVSRAKLAHNVAETVEQMRIAGGTVIHTEAGQRRDPPLLLPIPDSKDFRRLRRRWLPGFVLVGRDDLLAQNWARVRAKNAELCLLDAWLDLSRFNWASTLVTRSTSVGGQGRDQVQWHHDHTHGWIVPIPVGYGALSELYTPGSVANARDSTTPFRFVETLYSIGQWLGPHHIGSWSELLWYGCSEPDKGIYRARNDYCPPTSLPN